MTDTTTDASSTYSHCLHPHLAVEPPAPHVDNIHEVTKKPPAAKGPHSPPRMHATAPASATQPQQQPQMYQVAAAAATRPPAAARGTSHNHMHCAPQDNAPPPPDHTTHAQMDTETTTGLTPGPHNTTQDGQNVLHKRVPC